jgi:hypothetical protein
LSPEYLITVGASETGPLTLQVVAFQENSYVLVATLPLGLRLESSIYRVPVICHQYFGRVRNRVVIWAQESDTQPWVISEFDVDFGNQPSEWFKNMGSRHDTDIIEGIPLDRSCCMVVGERVFAINREGTMHQGKSQLSKLEDLRGRYRYTYDLDSEGLTWVEWSGTLVEVDRDGLSLFRYGLP